MEEADIIVTCPYNPAHRIRKFKFMSHVAKCKKTSKPVDKVECPLDNTHIVDRHRLREHIKTCSSVGKLMINLEAGAKPKVDIEPPLMNTYDSIENWEQEPAIASYNAMEVSSKKPVLRCVSGLTKSEKKKFRNSERTRMAHLKEFNYPNEATEASCSTKPVYEEVPLRPPRDTDIAISRIKTSQHHFNENTQMHNHDDNARMQAKFTPEYHDSFHRKLYDELAPEDDHIQQLEQSLRSTDTKISLRDYIQHINKENGICSEQNQSQDAKVKKTNPTSELLNIDKVKKEKDECTASTSSMSGERVTDKLLSLLKNESSFKKMQPTEETIKIDSLIKNDKEEPVLDLEILSKYNERLTYLVDIQNAAAEESVRILDELKKIKLSEENVSKK